MYFTFIQSWEKAFRLKINESLHHKVSLDPSTPIGLVSIVNSAETKTNNGYKKKNVH